MLTNEQNAGSGTLMYQEACAASDAVARLFAANVAVVRRVAARLRSHRPSAVLTIARGSSDNACTYGRYLIENRLGVLCASAGLSAGSIYQAPLATGYRLCIAVSQSGASPDLLAAVERVKRSGALVVGLINQPGSPLAALCDEVIELQAAPERSVAATKSFITSLAALAWLLGEWAQDEQMLDGVHALPELLSLAWGQDWRALVSGLSDATNVFVLGRGPGLGVAQEAALKLKETCSIHAEAFSAAEVLHGPMALIGNGFPVLAFAQGDETKASSIEVARRLSGMGAQLWLSGGRDAGATELPSVTAQPVIEPILSIQSFYRAAANLSIARGLDPDRPRHLAKVTRTL